MQHFDLFTVDLQTCNEDIIQIINTDVCLQLKSLSNSILFEEMPSVLYKLHWWGKWMMFLLFRELVMYNTIFPRLQVNTFKTSSILAK